ncbi:hypothetical protein D3C87_1373020 [compost metagenome]
MRLILGISFILFAQISTAQLPVGHWLNPQLTQDDGAFGKYYKGWLIVSDDKSIDQITTMGMHYDKTKLQILSDDGNKVRLFDKNENVETEITYEVTGNNLKMCPLNGGCTTYQQTLEKPATDPAPASYPRIQISTNWCIDNDCELVTFDGIASEMLYNLNEGFKPVFWQYAAPESLFARHGIRLHVLSYSYRFSNNSADLSSFMTSLILVAEQERNSDVIARSGALVLRKGPLSRLSATFQKHKISLDFSIAPAK